jgi:cell wall-associated NlpC family hydrolase
MHRGEELLLDRMVTRAVEITQDKIKPGDFVIYRFGHCYSHGGIITEWPLFVHAFPQAHKVSEDRADQGILFKRLRKFFTRKSWAE